MVGIEEKSKALDRKRDLQWVYLPTPGWWVRHDVDGSTSLIYKEGGEPRTVYGESTSHQPTYKNLAGQRVTPTRISSLLTQNPGDTFRPASYFWWRNQTDEGYYKVKAKQMLPFYLASTENFFVVDETSKNRLKFKCPVHGRLDTNPLYIGTRGQNPATIGPILIYINPSNDAALWYCPTCSKLDGHAVKHSITRELRDELAEDDVIPRKEWKHKDRLGEIDKLLDIIKDNPGCSFYELDHLMEWNSDGRNSERIINKHLKDKVKLKKRKRKKGYEVYIR